MSTLDKAFEGFTFVGSVGAPLPCIDQQHPIKGNNPVNTNKARIKLNVIIKHVLSGQWMNFFRKERWKSLRMVSLMKRFLSSGSSRAWLRNTTSSFHLLFIYITSLHDVSNNQR